ncbi:MAG: VCBS repeat-containing protein [Bacteroidales bacterium]|nr:VCBS repeat-containing protein [Bacteroidales bacterium]
MKTRSILLTLFQAMILLPIGTTLQGQVDFVKRPIELDFKGACSVNTADINGDGYTDVVAAGTEAGGIAWWANDGGYPPTFSKQIIDTISPEAIYVYPADIDGDGDVDLAIAGYTANKIAVWWNEGGNPVSWDQQDVDLQFYHAHEVKVADIDGDGDADLVGASAVNNEVAWWQHGSGVPVGWTKRTISTEVFGARSVFPVDIDADGDTDILSAGLDDDDVSVFINEGGYPITWTEQMIEDDLNGAHWVFSMDMDNDNDMDVLAACYMGAAIAIWYNDGNNPPQFTKFVLDGNFPGALSVVAAKIDEDDYPDVVAGGATAADVRVYYNDGTGSANFTRVILDPSFYGVWPVWVSDLDNDSDIDILSTSSTNNDIYWWDNQIVSTGMNPSGEKIQGLRLDKVYPNPFNQEVRIRYSVADNQHVTIQVFSIMGTLIRTLQQEEMSAGLHTSSWNGDDNNGAPVPEGIYLCRITSSGSVDWSYLSKRK